MGIYLAYLMIYPHWPTNNVFNQDILFMAPCALEFLIYFEPVGHEEHRFLFLLLLFKFRFLSLASFILCSQRLSTILPQFRLVLFLVHESESLQNFSTIILPWRQISFPFQLGLSPPEFAIILLILQELLDEFEFANIIIWDFPIHELPGKWLIWNSHSFFSYFGQHKN